MMAVNEISFVESLFSFRQFLLRHVRFGVQQLDLVALLWRLHETEASLLRRSCFVILAGGTEVGDLSGERDRAEGSSEENQKQEGSRFKVQMKREKVRKTSATSHFFH